MSRPLRGRVRVPGDKSISHRALMLLGIADGQARITGLLNAADVKSTASCMHALGADLRHDEHGIVVRGRPLTATTNTLDCGNSGTTMRLLTGLLAGTQGQHTLDGDASLRRRPMARVTTPLSAMGARIQSTHGHAPLFIDGHGALLGAEHRPSVASAQVKSALLLAGLHARGQTTVVEPTPSRDHTERMLRGMGVALQVQGDRITITGGQAVQATDVQVPGDISSAAFLLVAASLVPGSDLVLEGVGLNPTRTGVLDVLLRMGAHIEVLDTKTIAGEPVGDLRVKAAELQATEIGGGEIPRLIDELVVLGLAAACARGVTTVRGAAELRVKESDRVDTTVTMLRSLGAQAEGLADGWIVEGGGPDALASAPSCPTLRSHGDHRLALTAAVAHLLVPGGVHIEGAASMGVSYPDLPDVLDSLRR